MPLLCVGHSVQNCHSHVRILEMFDERNDQSMRTTLCLLIQVRCVLALSYRPGIVTGFRTKKQDSRPQHLIHVHWTDQVSFYKHLICRPRFKTSPSLEGPGVR